MGNFVLGFIQKLFFSKTLFSPKLVLNPNVLILLQLKLHS